MPANHSTFLAEAEDFPPYLCVLIARKDRKPVTQEQIAKATGFGINRVIKMWHSTTWAGVAIEDVDKFRAACGITRANIRRHRCYLKVTLDLDRTTTGLNSFRKRPISGQQKLIEILKQHGPPKWLKDWLERKAA